MKKLTLFAVILSSMVIYAYSDYDMCAGTIGHKALACSACHGGSFANDIIILDGKADPESDTRFDIAVRVPESILASLQLAVQLPEERGIRLDSDKQSVVKETSNSTLFSLVSLNQKSLNDAESFYTTLHLEFDEPLTEVAYITIHGVLSNGDGTSQGDYTFSKEVVLEPAQKNLDAYFSNNSFYVGQRANELLRVVDLQGRVVYKQYIADSEARIDLSELESGIYQAVVGDGSKGFQSMAIQVK